VLARDIAELVFRKLIHLFAFAGMTDNSSNSVNLPEIFFMFLLQNYRYEKNYLNHFHSKRALLDLHCLHYQNFLKLFSPGK